MTLFKRGGKWWYEFVFQGRRIRESTHFDCVGEKKGREINKPLAATAEKAHRERLANFANGVVAKPKVVSFSDAGDQWLRESAHWSDSTREIYSLKMGHLKDGFGKLLLVEITPGHISTFQLKRLQAKASPREINMECAVLRMVLRKNRLWHLLAPDFRPLRESENIGKALTADEEDRLLAAARKSRSLSLYPALVVLLNTGLRVSELRTMQWQQVDMLGQSLTVGRSKTKGGEGRVVPLNEDAFTALSQWRQSFPNPDPEHYVFPSERYGLKGEDGYKHGAVAVWDRHPEQPIGSWKVSWGACRKLAKVDCRLHDLRHTFVSKLGAAQVSDQTVMALAGHMSRKMMERYSHSRNEAKRQAVGGLSTRSIQ